MYNYYQAQKQKHDSESKDKSKLSEKHRLEKRKGNQMLTQSNYPT
jgi:hypothetical protein